MEVIKLTMEVWIWWGLQHKLMLHVFVWSLEETEKINKCFKYLHHHISFENVIFFLYINIGLCHSTKINQCLSSWHQCDTGPHVEWCGHYLCAREEQTLNPNRMDRTLWTGNWGHQRRDIAKPSMTWAGMSINKVWRTGSQMFWEEVTSSRL